MVTTEPLKVFGSESKFRAECRKRIKTGREDLSGLVELAANEVASLPPRDPMAKGLAAMLDQFHALRALETAEASIARWEVGNWRLLSKFLGTTEADSAYPRLTRNSWTPNRDEPQVRLEDCERRLKYGLQALLGVLARLPEKPQTLIRPPEDRFSELRQVGLIENAALNSYVRRMSKTTTRAQASEAIGAAKELVEACHRACLDRLGVSYPKDDFGKLGKTVRVEVLKREGATPSTTAANAIDQVFAGLGSVELALATLRNELGTGHGKAALPKGLRPRHAQLAIDIADTHVRYLVATLVDLKLL